MHSCEFCEKPLSPGESCDCWDALISQGDEQALPLDQKTIATTLPQNDSLEKNKTAVGRELITVFSEAALPFHRNRRKKSSLVLSKTSSFLLLGIHLVALFFFFLSLHHSIQTFIGDAAPPSGFVVLLPLICLGIHLFVHAAFLFVFNSSSEKRLPLEDALSIISSNTSTWSITLLLIGLLLRLFSLTSSFSAFLIFLLLSYCYLGTCFLFSLRLQHISPQENKRLITVVTTTSVQTALIFVALFSQILRIIDQSIGALFR